MVFNITQFLKLDKFMHFLLDCSAYMNNKTKLKIIENPIKNKFNRKMFNVWLKRKQKTPHLLVCFWCGDNLELKKFFNEDFKFFVTTKNGEIFERPTYGHKKFNNLYQNIYNVELCNSCYYNLDMFNKTGLWCEYTLEEKK